VPARSVARSEWWLLTGMAAVVAGWVSFVGGAYVGGVLSVIVAIWAGVQTWRAQHSPH
jgi:hypothetical protein